MRDSVRFGTPVLHRRCGGVLPGDDHHDEEKDRGSGGGGVQLATHGGGGGRGDATNGLWHRHGLPS
jgi:hypothetical protein